MAAIEGSKKAQSAMEYLMTYGWAILIISLAIVIVFELINVNSLPVQQCIMPAGFSCINYFMLQNGLLSINILQTTQYPINITAIGCTTVAGVSNMQATNIAKPALGVAVPISSNYSMNVQCFANGTVATGNPGSIFSGWVAINYTQAYTNIPQTVFGKLTTKYT
ncbi:MAG: hypothetical protein KGH72_02740 [Candidatus Micrarchaeota archaeon]|nr:hypothetical protein [Candidatus Micrarchaeota archaeon]